ncbi:unnamed protein product (macronuclear) [Paramecium tetraurelia]|uniref:BEACH domain-containing protein n=1 Tax=Paramecium tetraurelia TaxID=5888 RepID=A0BRP0_PARTE|nr:uncharacterized protein GSPATT00031438001 [Paramecium tetraurelia]CAK61207.1 unnamed protein product [Paramecium tetraurelia]|eukprot:XP_001428605.1 hypothetical protein (macronuclear) [Paramecium tetraurelia strain d4-2]
MQQLVKKFNTKLHKRVQQFFYQDDTIQIDELQVTQAQIAEMEQIIPPKDIILDFSKSYFHQIDQNLELAPTTSTIFYCFLSLKKIIEIPNNPSYDKKLLDLDETTLKESNDGIGESQIEKDRLQNSQEFVAQNMSFQAKCEYHTQLFEAIHFFVSIIQERLSVDTDFMQNIALAKPLLYDITQIYLVYYLRLYRINIEANSHKFFLEYYERGQTLFRLACLHFNQYQTQNLLNLLYNFRIVTILAIILSNKLQYLQKVIQDFLNYHYSTLENMESLFKFEQTLKSTIFEYCLSVSNQNMFQQMFQEILTLDQRFINNCYILELKWLLFSRYLSSDILEETKRSLIEDYITNSMQWKDQFLQLIRLGSKRLLFFFINIEKFSNSNAIITKWQEIIIDIIKSCFKIEPNQQFEEEFIEQLFKFILNSLQHILKYNQKKNKRSNKILQLLEDSIHHPLAKEYRFQKKLLDILILSDLACYGDNIENYIFNFVSPSSFTFDPINTAKYILICNQNACRQKIINHIYYSIVKYKKMSTMDPKINLCQVIQQLHQMIAFFEQEKTVNQDVKFLSQQIRFALRSILTIFVISDESIQQDNTNSLLNQHPLLFLEKSFQEIEVHFDVPSRNTFDLSCALHISQYLKKVLDFANSTQNCELEDLYDILTCQLKIIKAIQKFLLLDNDIIALNQFFDNIDQSLYKFMVKVLIQELSATQMKFIFENIIILIFEDRVTKNLSSINESIHKYFNYRLMKIFLSIMFECELPAEYKKQIVDRIYELVNYNILQFSSIVNKIILLLAIEKNQGQDQIRQKMIEIIQLICGTSLSNIQLKSLLRLCFGGSNKLLIFRNQIPDYQQSQQLADSVFENDSDLINIYFEPQLKLVDNYSFKQGLSDFLSIFNSLLEEKDSYILFKDFNSYINLPIQFPITKGFTIYFEIQLNNQGFQEVNGFQESQEIIIPQEIRQQYYEIVTLYSEKIFNKISGVKILISQKCVQIRQFKFVNKQEALVPVFQNYEINVPESLKYNYQINYKNGSFTVIVNGKLCKSEQKKLMEINQIVQIDLGKSMESTCTLSYIFATQQFDYETNIFRGKMFNFILTDQVQNESILESQVKTKQLIKFSKFTKVVNPFVLSDMVVQDLFEVNDTIQYKEIETHNNQINSISCKQISNVRDILKHSNIQSLILHVFQEILNQKQMKEYENQISDLLSILLNKIILRDEEILKVFFKEEFNLFIQILKQLTSKVKIQKLLQILENFNDKLSESYQQYYSKFTNEVIYNFQFFEKFIEDEVILNNYFMKTLQQYQIPFEKIVTTKQFFQFLKSYIIWPFQSNIKIKHENLFYKFVNDMQLFAKLFEYQDLSSDYLEIIELYFKIISSKFQQAMRSNLNKYSQNTLIINSKNDILYLSALLNACKMKTYQNINFENGNFIYLLIHIEDYHKENLQYNPNIVNSLISEIFYFRDSLRRNLNIIQTIIEEIKSVNSLCAIINLLAYVLHDNIQILNNKYKPSIIDQICLKLTQQQQDLLEISNNTMLELLFDSLRYKDLPNTSQEVYVQLLKQKISCQHLNSIDLGRLIKIYSQTPEIFYRLLHFIKNSIQIQKLLNQVVILANLIKMLNIIKKDCFAKDQTFESKQQCSILLSFYIEYFQQKNFFKFNLKKKQKENQQIENQLSCGGLFGLFAEIFCQALKNQSQEFVIDNILKLLHVYKEEMNKKTDDSFVQELYGLFNYSSDKNGIKFPSIVKVFKDINQNASEGQLKKIQEVISQIEQQQETQFKGNHDIVNSMLAEFNNQIKMIEGYHLQLEQKYEEYKRNTLKFIEEDSSKSISTNTTFNMSLNVIKIKDEEDQKESSVQQTSQLNLYIDFNLWNNFMNLTSLRQFIKGLNEEILWNQKSQKKNYKIKWKHSNLVDYENKIIFKKYIFMKNQANDQNKLNSFNPIFESKRISVSEDKQECKVIIGTLKNILDKCEEVRIKIMQSGIKFFDPFRNEEIVITNQKCKVTIMKYQNQEKSFLIKQFEQSYQSFYFLIINEENQFKQLKKHFQNLDLLKTKSISEIKKNLIQKWQQGQLSNYQYIYLVNQHSGRNLMDINNYFIFPWTTVHLNNSFIKVSRQFSQSIFSQKQAKNQGYFYSSGAQLYYFLSQGQERDSVNQTQVTKSIENSIAEMKIDGKTNLIKFMDELQKLGEAMPEFYSNPQFFSDCILPNWVITQTPEEFIYIMRAQLESRIVQEILPFWLDLVFGIQPTLKGQQFQQQLKPNEFVSQSQISLDRNLNRAIMNAQDNGQSIKQFFTEKHLPRKIFHNYFGDQAQIKMTTRRLLYQGDEKIISSYYYSCHQFVLITEKGTAIILDVNEQLYSKMIVESDCLMIKQKKQLETKSPLTHQLICFVDFDNQNFPDKQESQAHVIETEKLSLFQSCTIFFILGGYRNGEFRSYKGNSLKYKQHSTQNNSNIQCIRICHARCALIIGQEDGGISLWELTKEYEISSTPFLVISTHVYSITNIDCSTSQILSVDLINEVHIHYYNGSLIKKIQLTCYGSITYCQISYTMNLYIFLNSFNKLMAYNRDGKIFIHPIEIPQKINNIIPLTPFSSEFIYMTDSGFYFDDIFIMKMKQDGLVIEKNQDKKIYDQNFALIKAIQGQKLLLSDRSGNYITSTQIIFQQSEFAQLRFQTVGCDNGNFWCLYNDEEILHYFEKKLQRSGLK